MEKIMSGVKVFNCAGRVIRLLDFLKTAVIVVAAVATLCCCIKEKQK